MSAEPNKATIEAEDLVVLNGPGSLLSMLIVLLPLAIHAGLTKTWLPSFSLQLACGNW